MLDLANKSPEEIQKIITEAQAALVDRQRSQRKEVLAQIKNLADSIGITVIIKEEGRRSTKGSAVAAKYRNPKNPAESWSGRGLKPKWITRLESEGISLDSLRI
jgi:DNA-binding protein H-NS